jgi:hypothetical protein
VVKAVMPPAESEKIRGVGGPAVLPVGDMVDVQPPAAVTSRYPAAPVSVLDDDTGPVWDGAECPAYAHRSAARLDHRADTSVTAYEAAQAVAQRRAQVQVGTSLPIALGAHV